jgi:hypothetical protein
VLWFSWVDDCFITGPVEDLTNLKNEIMSKMDCDDGGEVKEFVGCKIEYNRAEKWLKLTQPVLIQSYADEFQINEEKCPLTPGIPIKTMQLGNKPAVLDDRRTYYRTGVGKLLHLKRWSRPDMNNFSTPDR